MGIWLAFISLIGALAASGTVTELVKRRDSRASIKSDLEIWEKLPDCATKDKLFDQVTSRIWHMTSNRDSPARWPGYAFGLLWTVGTLVLLVVNDGMSLRRDDKGVLRVVASGINLQFQYAVYLGIGILVVNALWLGLVSWLVNKFTGPRSKGCKNVSADTAGEPASAPAQSPNPPTQTDDVAEGLGLTPPPQARR